MFLISSVKNNECGMKVGSRNPKLELAEWFGYLLWDSGQSNHIQGWSLLGYVPSLSRSTNISVT